MKSHSRYYHIKECSMNNGEDAFIVLMAIVFVITVIAMGVYYA